MTSILSRRRRPLSSKSGSGHRLGLPIHIRKESTWLNISFLIQYRWLSISGNAKIWSARNFESWMMSWITAFRMRLWSSEDGSGCELAKILWCGVDLFFLYVELFGITWTLLIGVIMDKGRRCFPFFYPGWVWMRILWLSRLEATAMMSCTSLLETFRWLSGLFIYSCDDSLRAEKWFAIVLVLTWLLKKIGGVIWFLQSRTSYSSYIVAPVWIGCWWYLGLA